MGINRRIVEDDEFYEVTRFLSENVIDRYYPNLVRRGQSDFPTFWPIWKEFHIPKNIGFNHLGLFEEEIRQIEFEEQRIDLRRKRIIEEYGTDFGLSVYELEELPLTNDIGLHESPKVFTSGMNFTGEVEFVTLKELVEDENEREEFLNRNPAIHLYCDDFAVGRFYSPAGDKFIQPVWIVDGVLKRRAIPPTILYGLMWAAPSLGTSFNMVFMGEGEKVCEHVMLKTGILCVSPVGYAWDNFLALYNAFRTLHLIGVRHIIYLPDLDRDGIDKMIEAVMISKEFDINCMIPSVKLFKEEYHIFESMDVADFSLPLTLPRIASAVHEANEITKDKAVREYMKLLESIEE